jgi:hypothetical protein
MSQFPAFAIWCSLLVQGGPSGPGVPGRRQGAARVSRDYIAAGFGQPPAAAKAPGKGTIEECRRRWPIPRHDPGDPRARHDRPGRGSRENLTSSPSLPYGEQVG